MSEELNENDNSQNVATEEVDNTDAVEETTADVETEDLEDLREKNKRLFERAKKAEAEAKLLKSERIKKEEQAKAKAVEETVPAKKQEGLTAMDTIALISAKVTEKDDIEFVSEYAAFKHISVSEALKSPIVKSELAVKMEQRQTAEATNTSTARRGSSKPTTEQILNAAASGKFPEDPAELVEARYQSKKK